MLNSSSDLDDLIADDFLEFGASGKQFNKKQVISFLLNDKPAKKSISKAKVKPLSKNHYLLTYKYLRSANGVKIYSFRSSIWKLERKKWQIIFHQGTPTN